MSLAVQEDHHRLPAANSFAGHIPLHVDLNETATAPAPAPDQHHQSSNNAIGQEHLQDLIEAIQMTILHPTGLVSETTFGMGSAAYAIANENESEIVTLNGKVARIEKAVDGMMASLQDHSAPPLTQRMDMVEDIIDVLFEREIEKDSIDTLSDRVARVEEAVTKMIEMMKAFADMRDMKHSLTAVAGITTSFHGRRLTTARDRPIKQESR
ncbi:MAG: hypothetical protein Q9184_002388 [Pyrenodesmia sp. 2 TL-2023]